MQGCILGLHGRVFQPSLVRGVCTGVVQDIALIAFSIEEKTMMDNCKSVENSVTFFSYPLGGSRVCLHGEKQRAAKLGYESGI